MRFPTVTRKHGQAINIFGDHQGVVDAELLIPEDLVGKVCVCSTGRVGIVTSKGSIEVPAEDNEFETVVIHGWRGIGLDGKGTWFSSNPVIVAENAEEFRAKLEQRRFGGLMCMNG